MSLPEAEARRVREAEACLGVTFSAPLLLLEALTHRSYLNEQTLAPTPSNERLEFLGDSVLGFLVGRYVFERYPDMPEGDLTSCRAALIRTSTLADWSRQLGLPSLLRLGQGELANPPVRESILADAFEAVIAALLQDQGLDAVDRFLSRFLSEQADAIVQQARSQNFKGVLQELVQEREHYTPVYRTVKVEGPDHDSVFTVEVLVGERVLGQGVGRSKQAAQQAAAEAALAQYAAAAEEQ